MSRILVALVLCCLAACDAEDPCGAGMVESQSTCVPAPDDAGGDGDADAATDAGGDRDADAAASEDDAGSCEGVLEDEIGTACTSDDDCGCAAPYCARQPGTPTGTCTIQGCTVNGDECPAGYMCFDLSALGVSGYEPFCVAAL